MLIGIYSLLVFFFIFFLVVFFEGGYLNKIIGVGVYWTGPYECGFCSNSISLDSFSFTYFSLLVFFVIFDLEISLLLNMPEQGLLYDNFWFYYTFLVMLMVGFVLELITGYVRWGI